MTGVGVRSVSSSRPPTARWFGRREGLPEVYVVDRGRIVFRDLREMFPEDVAALARYARRT